MNICKWCNNQVSDDKTVWYRRNLLLGYSFCSTRCATQWKQSENDSNQNKSKDISTEDFQIQQEERRLLREQQDIENIETAQKIMVIVQKLFRYWKIVIPFYVFAFTTFVLLLDVKHTLIIIIVFLLPILAATWAYFTAPKS